MKKIVISILYSTFLFSTAQSFAQTKTIELPKEELARDTALPVFDVTKVVRNRFVRTKGRFELAGGVGFNMTEALYNEISFGVGVGYNFTETHAANLFGFFFQDGLSGNGRALQSGEGNLNGSIIFDAELAPHPENAILADYQFTAWYGKVSVTKKAVMNLSLYGLLGVNSVNFGDSSSVGIHLGFGQKFYMGRHFAFRYDMRALMYKGPNPADDKLNPGSPLSSGDKRTSDEVGEITYFPIIFNVGLAFVF